MFTDSPMRRPLLARTAGLFGVVFAVVAMSACNSDSLTQPDVAARNGKFNWSTAQIAALINSFALTRDDAVPAGMVRSFTFTAKGGTIDLKETGLRVEVPAGAIPGTTLTIVVTALPGKVVGYDFQPHGTVFLKPLTFTQDLSKTSWDKLGFVGVITGGYFKDASQVNLLTGLSQLDELFPVSINKKEVSFPIKHFSGYMVATGRMDNDAASEF